MPDVEDLIVLIEKGNTAEAADTLDERPELATQESARTDVNGRLLGAIEIRLFAVLNQYAVPFGENSGSSSEAGWRVRLRRCSTSRLMM